MDFPVSCRAEVRDPFQRAVAVLHSFGYEEARRAFEALAEQDPGCGMAAWGVAMTYWHPLWAQPTSEELARGAAAAARAASMGAGTERERAYVGAIGAFYRGADRIDHRTRALAYRDAMEKLAADFPGDHEARILHALAILGSAAPGDGLAGAARAARVAGEADKAVTYYRSLVDLAGSSSSRGRVLAEARDYLARTGG